MKLIKVLMDSPPLSESNHASKFFQSPLKVIVLLISIEFNEHIKECDDYYMFYITKFLHFNYINKIID